MSDARNTIENKCFSGIDYDLIKDLFGKNCVSNVSQILCDSPSTASDFEFSQSQPESLDKQSKSVIPLENDRPTFFCVPEREILCESSASLDTLCEQDTSNDPNNISPGSPSILPPTSEFRTEPIEDDLTDCESPNKQQMPLNLSPLDSPSRYDTLLDLPTNVSPELHYSEVNLIPTSEILTDESLSSESEIDDSDADPDYENLDRIETRISESDESLLSLCEIVQEENINPKTRKRKANPALWKRNRAKELRNSGQEYKTLKKGKLVPSRTIGLPCTDSCRRKCTLKISEDERKEYFQSFWSLKDLNRQRQFIANSMELIQPKYRYPVLRENRTARKLNHTFFMYKAQEKVSVCKTFFTSTLGITNRCIRTVLEKTEKGFTSEDRRGKHEKHGTIPQEVKDGARNHISSIPTVESHYTRADSSKNYIEGGRTLMDLYRDYKQDCQKENRDFVTLSIYRKIFNFEFNIEFFKPKKDLCQFCESYKNKDYAERLDVEIEYMRHHEEKNIARTEKEEDKTKISKNYRVACFDLQAALPTPKGEVSTFYYKSKLSTYNFTICDLNKKGLGTVNCYIWHEGEGHKGSNEIGSCLLHYLEMCASRQDIPGCSSDVDEVEVVLYSDNCGGQGKNKFIIAAYLYAVSNFNLKGITHKFLVVGHTQNEGDVSHSLIEKNIKKALKSNPIYLPSQYATLISTARKSGESFKVHELDHSFFFDLKDIIDTTATNFNVNTRGEKFNFNDICVLRVEKENPGIFFYKTSYKDDNYKTVNIRSSRTRKQLRLIQDAQLKKAYPDKIPISQRKFQDLMSLVNSNTIPRCYADFFQNLKHD